MVIVGAVALSVTAFDSTYLDMRDIYWRQAPMIVRNYDPLKGIEPHRDTEGYLALVRQLRNQYEALGSQSPEVSNTLANLRTASEEIIDRNPFQSANKIGNLERLKSLIRHRMNNGSAKQSWRAFWSLDYLNKKQWQSELEFFDQDIKSLMEVNYFRRYDRNGNLVDFGWKIDLALIAIFGSELAIGSFLHRKQFLGGRWRRSIASRWFDLLWFLPFFRWLRIVPFTMRLIRAKWLNISPIQEQIDKYLITRLATELSEIILIQILNQTQTAIKRGAIGELINERLIRPYIDTNNVNELAEIVDIVVDVAIYRILPQIQPDIEAIVRHLLKKAIAESPVYQNLLLIPGIAVTSQETIDRLVGEVSNSLYSGLVKAIGDTTTTQLTEKLAIDLTTATVGELKKGDTAARLQSLISDLIEEIKISYIR
jgi:hypothetical protein